MRAIDQNHENLGIEARWWPYLLLLVLLTAVSYGNTLHSPFVLDDFKSFVNNHEIHVDEISLASLRQLSNTDFGIRRLVPVLTFAADSYLGGGSIVQYHLTNIAIHLLCTVAVFLLVRKLLLTSTGAVSRRYLSAAGYSVVVTGLWALNPVQTNAVTYLVQRMTSLAALFYVTTLVCYIYGRLARSLRQRNLFLIIAAVSAMASFMSKENSFTLPAAVLMVEMYFLSPGDLHRTARKLSLKHWMLAILGILALLALFFPLVRDFSPSIFKAYAVRDFTMGERLLTELRVVVFYISLLILPLPGRMNLEHDFPLSFSLFTPSTTFISLILLLGLFMAGFLTRRSRPLVSFGIFWFFLHLLIESTVVPLEIIFEHRLYLPSIGFFLVIASLIDSAAGVVKERYSGKLAQKVSLCAVVFFLASSSILTIARNQDWQDALTIYTDIVRKSPDKARPHNDLGVIYAEMGDYDTAREHYQAALEQDSENAESYNNFGKLYARMGLLDLAVNSYRQAIEARPDRAEFYNNLGSAYSRKGLTEKALEAFRQALERNPRDPGFYTNIGDVYERRGLSDKAAQAYRKALDIRPDYAEAYNKLGIIYGKKGSADKAIEFLLAALRIDPENPGYHHNVANAYMMRGLTRKAEEHRRLAVYYQERGKMNGVKGDIAR